MPDKFCYTVVVSIGCRSVHFPSQQQALSNTSSIHSKANALVAAAGPNSQMILGQS